MLRRDRRRVFLLFFLRNALFVFLNCCIFAEILQFKAMKWLRVILWTIFGLIAMVLAIVLTLYSPWGGNATAKIVSALVSDSTMTIHIGKLDIDWPLRVHAGDVNLSMADGLRLRADMLDADLSINDLLRLNLSMSRATIDRLNLDMGAEDSLMYMRLHAEKADLRSASMRLSDLHIAVDSALLCGGDLALQLNPDTAAVAPPKPEPSEPSTMLLSVNHLAIDRFHYQMRMLPTIDSLAVSMNLADAADIAVNLGEQSINVRRFDVDGADIAYIAPDSATVAATPPARVDTIAPDTAPWTITLGSAIFDHARALYTTRGITPADGLDFGYIDVDSMQLAVNDFYNQAAQVTVPLKLRGIERCGIALTASGRLDIDERGLRLSDFNIQTDQQTALTFSALMGLGDLAADPSLPLHLNLDGQAASADLSLMFPDFNPYIAAMPARIDLTTVVSGTSGRLSIGRLNLAAPGMLTLNGQGLLSNAFLPGRLGGNISLDGSLININPLMHSALEETGVFIPTTTFNLDADFSPTDIGASLRALSGGGRLDFDGELAAGDEYFAALTAENFPLHSFLPGMDLGPLTATLIADGQGFDIADTAMALQANFAIAQAYFNGYDYAGISGELSAADGMAVADIRSTNGNAQFALHADGNLAGDVYHWKASLNAPFFDLLDLNFADVETTASANLDAEMEYAPQSNDLNANLLLHSLRYTTPISAIRLSDVDTRLSASDSTSILTITDGDLNASASIEASLQRLMAVSDTLSAEFDHQFSSRIINIDRIFSPLPKAEFDLTAGRNNFLADIAAGSRASFDNINIHADNDLSFYLNSEILGFRNDEMRIDTTRFEINQFGPRLIYQLNIGNRPGTFDKWANVDIDGYIFENSAAFHMQQHDITGEQGYDVGAAVALLDSVLTMSLEPLDPTIAYKPWTVNDDNYISWNFNTSALDANLHLNSATSAVDVFTDAGDLNLNLHDIRIEEWVNLNPFAPPMRGSLSADMKISHRPGSLSGSGDFALTDFYYNRQRVGDVATHLTLATDTLRQLQADLAMKVDGVETVTLRGVLSDTTSASPLNLDMRMIHLPLASLNPFMPEHTASLKGYLNGTIDVSGRGLDPRFNGWLQFDSAAVRVAIIGTEYPISDVRVPLDSNIVRFNSFGIYGVNNEAMTLNGTVDLRSMAKPSLDLTLSAKNFQACNTGRAPRYADIYGKAFISTNTTVRGNSDFIDINSRFDILSGTNVTYIMSDASQVIAAKSMDELVEFVAFADTTATTVAEDENSMAMRLLAQLNINNGTTISVDLSPDGKDRVRMQCNGNFDFQWPAFADPRLTGRLNITGGFARYSPPLLGEKSFDFNDGSYIAFTGDMLNPILALSATDRVKANVKSNGAAPRSINFDVGLNVGGTLSAMDVKFDLSTIDDISIANELQSMSAEQRANQAMNMLLYGVYTGASSSTDGGSISGNALYSFLTSQINSWAANTIQGVDLSFGIDQTNNEQGVSSMSYSYQVSKSLFNDRFKIVVGGNYATDASADENFSQNLIKDISFEYYLNPARTMMARLFRHTGYESILEGEITKTGVGFVYRRSLTSLRQLFGLRPKKADRIDNQSTESASSNGTQQ